MKKVIGFGVLLIVILFGCFAWIFFSKNIEIPIQQSLIEQKIKEKMPIKKKYLQLLEIEISDPKIHLDALKKRVGLDITIKAQLNQLLNASQTWQGNIGGSSELRYDAKSGALYLNHFAIEKMDLQGLNEKYKDVLTKQVSEGLNEYFNKHPAYTFNDKQAKQAIAKKVLKDLRVEGDALVIVLGR